jgi:hypothetical protein
MIKLPRTYGPPGHYLRQSRTLPANDEELAAQPTQPATLDQLQTLLEEFVSDYNIR